MKYLKKFENIDIDWDDFDEEESSGESKDDLIDNIVSSMINIEDGSITMGEMEAESSPCLYNENGEYHLIEVLYENFVQVVEYGGYKGEQEMGNYIVLYKNLDKDILKEINNLLENYFKNYED